MTTEAQITDIAVRQNGGAVQTTPEPQVPGIEDFGREDSVMPRLRLVQAQSDFSDKLGHIFNNITGEAAESIEVVVIGLRKSRVRWPPPPFSRDQEVLCASDDAKVARDEMAGLDTLGDPTQDCARCVYAQWADGPKGKRVPPPCSLQYNFLVIDVTDDLPSLITFSRTSAGAGKVLVTMVKAFGYRRTYKIGVAAESNEIGKYFVYTVGKGNAVVPERLQHYAALAEQYRSVEINSDEGDTSFDPEKLNR